MRHATKPSDLKIRRAKSSDSARLAILCTELGYPATANEMKARLSRITPLADQRQPSAGVSPARGSQWPGSRRRTEEQRSGSTVDKCRRELGPEEKMRQHVRSVERDPRARSRFLPT